MTIVVRSVVRRLRIMRVIVLCAAALVLPS